MTAIHGYKGGGEGRGSQLEKSVRAGCVTANIGCGRNALGILSHYGRSSLAFIHTYTVSLCRGKGPLLLRCPKSIEESSQSLDFHPADKSLR